MNTNWFKLWLIGGLLVGSCAPAGAALTTNNWSDGNGKWELGANWSAGTPSLANAIDFVTGGIPVGPRTITIDGASVSSNLLNGCLSVSNLTVGGTSLAPDTLFLNTNASGTPGNTGLSVANALTILSHGILSITNSYLRVSTFGMDGGIFDDGFILLNTGTLITHTSIVSPITIGYNGTGQMTVQSGFLQSYRIIVGYFPGSQGTLTIAGGTVDNAGNGLAVGNWVGGAGTVWLTGGQLLQTNNDSSTTIGGNTVGQMTVSNGTWQSASFGVGPMGTLTFAGGASTFGGASVGGTSSNGGAVWMTGGQLSLDRMYIGLSGLGQMTVSNGMWQADQVIVGEDYYAAGLPSTGTLTVAGGSNIFSSLHLGILSNCVGTIWLTGGSLIITNTYVGEISADGRITVSNGTWLANEIDVGASLGSYGTLTVSGGQMVVTNGAGRIAVGVAASDMVFFSSSGSGQGRMFVGSAGSVVTRVLDVGSDNSPRGDLEIGSSGLLTVLSKMTVGDCVSNGLGTVVMTGGRFYVTNATHDAVLEVRDGFFLFDGGTLVVDKLVVTNTCYGVFDRGGGTLTVGTLVVDPNGDADGDGLPNWWEQLYGLDPLSTFLDNGPDGDPDGDGYSNWAEYLAGSDPRNPLSTPLQITPPLQITSILRSGNNIVLTWTTPGGTTNQVQTTSGGTAGIYSTNGFTNLGAQMLIGGSGVSTNYTDNGGATNKPARYYRVRLVP